MSLQCKVAFLSRRASDTSNIRLHRELAASLRRVPSRRDERVICLV
jgi:hypothetical protein